jgi:hypothetical protein
MTLIAVEESLNGKSVDWMEKVATRNTVGDSGVNNCAAKRGAAPDTLNDARRQWSEWTSVCPLRVN